MKFNPIIEHLKTYEPGKPIELVAREFGIEPRDIVKLASNENPKGCSQRVIKAVADATNLMYRYPDDSMMELKAALCKRFGIDEKEIIIGAGSDQVIEFLSRAKLYNGAKILQSEVTFAMYQIYAKACGADVIKASGLMHDLDEMYRLYKEHNPEIIFICAPNNPTGDCLDFKDIEDFIKKIDQDTLVVVDGAYQEYAAYKDKNKAIDPAKLIRKFSNAIYLGTFSKAYGLGGMRVGYAIASEYIIKALYKLRPPFNVTTLSLIAAVESLKDVEFVKESIKESFEQMDFYVKFAQKFKIEFIDSYTNFITYILDGVNDSTYISDALLRKGIIVRNLKGYGLNAIRITIGKGSENQRFFNAMQELLKAGR